ncbi:hypothetical protein QEN19_000753 [Hanseniaspora menglaensis]
MSSFLDFKNKFENKISKHDSRKNTNRFADIVGLPDSVKVKKNTIHLAGGTPYETLFPFKKIDVEYRNSPGKLGEKDPSGSETIEKQKSFSIPLYKEHENQSDISTAFQYQYSNGSSELLAKTKKIVEALNMPGYKGWDTVMTSGSSDSMNKTFALLVDDETTVLCEEFTYPNVFHNCSYHGGTPVPLKMHVTDDKTKQGINIEYLKEFLEAFETNYPGKKKKIVLYTICTGHNPTALTESYEKRKQIYELCKNHGVFIIEDDPYGYLQLPKFDKTNPLVNAYDESVTLESFVKDLLVPSYITIDTEGIVLRMETFSKVVSPGLRLGFIVGNSYFIKRLSNISNMTNRNPAGSSQAIVNNLLDTLSTDYKALNPDAKWIDGWLDWCMKIAGTYTKRRNILFKAIYESEAYKKHLFTLLEPSCGMFASIVVNLKPEYIAVIDSKVKGQDKINKIKRAMDYLLCCLLEAGTVVILGYKMTVSKDFSMERATFLRITFAKASSENEFVKGAKGLSDGFETFFNEYMTENERWNLLPTGLEGM